MTGFNQLVGFERREWGLDHAEVVLALGPQHMNSRGVVHGGVIAAMIDAACGWACRWSGDTARPLSGATLSLTTHYIAAVSGGSLRAVGRRRGGGRRIMVAGCEVFDAEGRLVATGEAGYRLSAVPPPA